MRSDTEGLVHIFTTLRTCLLKRPAAGVHTLLLLVEWVGKVPVTFPSCQGYKPRHGWFTDPGNDADG